MHIGLLSHMEINGPTRFTGSRDCGSPGLSVIAVLVFVIEYPCARGIGWIAGVNATANLLFGRVYRPKLWSDPVFLYEISASTDGALA